MSNVLGGHKATLNSVCTLPGDSVFTLTLLPPDPKVSEEAKEHSRDVLREHDALDEQ